MKTIIENSKILKEIAFPLLVQSFHSNLIVLFTDAHTGTVIVEDMGKDSNKNKIGTFKDDWTSCLIKGAWTPLDEVTITFTR